jgi:hypothetical protein
MAAGLYRSTSMVRVRVHVSVHMKRQKDAENRHCIMLLDQGNIPTSQARKARKRELVAKRMRRLSERQAAPRLRRSRDELS